MNSGPGFCGSGWVRGLGQCGLRARYKMRACGLSLPEKSSKKICFKNIANHSFCYSNFAFWKRGLLIFFEVFLQEGAIFACGLRHDAGSEKCLRACWGLAGSGSARVHLLPPTFLAVRPAGGGGHLEVALLQLVLSPEQTGEHPQPEEGGHLERGHLLAGGVRVELLAGGAAGPGVGEEGSFWLPWLSSVLVIAFFSL